MNSTTGFRDARASANGAALHSRQWIEVSATRRLTMSTRCVVMDNGPGAGRRSAQLHGGLHYNCSLCLYCVYVYVLALVVWVGGMAVLGAIVAPSAFEVLQSSDPARGRVLAGSVVGESLRRFSWVAYGAGVSILGSLVIMALIGPRPRGFGMRAAIAAGMLAIALYSGLVLAQNISRLQAAASGPISELPAGDPLRAEFGRAHGLANLLMLVNLAGGLVLLLWEAREN